MANRIRSFIESLVFAGLKPSGGVSGSPRPPRRFGWLRDKIERFLSGGRSDDPLYLSNRTWKQRVALGLMVAMPLALILGAIALLYTNVFRPKAPPLKEPTAAEKIAHLLPDLQNTVHIDTVKGAEVDELHVLCDGTIRVAGVLMNKTDFPMSVNIDLDLADRVGSRVGATTQRVSNVPPHSSVRFEFPAADPTTSYVLVRKIRPAD